MKPSTVKAMAKRVAQGVALVIVFPVLAVTRFLQLFTDPDGPFQAASQGLSLVPGRTGIYLRAAYYHLTLPRCGPDVCICFGTILCQSTIELGQRVYIGAYCTIGHSIIEDDVVIGSNVDILSGRSQHYFADLETPIREQGGHLETIRLGADCWIGNSSVVMADIGEKSIVGAGSVVTREVPPKSIVVGNPAKVVRNR